MGYTLHVTLKDEQGALIRLPLLLNQRGLVIEALSVGYYAADRMMAVIRIRGDAEQAHWAARQLTRMRSVESVQVLGEGDRRHWALMRIPAPVGESSAHWASRGLRVVGGDAMQVLVEYSGHPEEVETLASELGGQVVSSVLCPGAVAAVRGETGNLYDQPEQTFKKGRIGNGRTYVVRRGRGSRVAQ